MWSGFSLAASDEDQQQGPGVNQAAWKTILEFKLSTVLYKIRNIVPVQSK
jgi:hypothetical protein